jgi:4-hydroxy-tetrahydrodipicolinate synthase
MPDIRAALKGISGVPVTPFDVNDRVAQAPLKALIGRLAEAGVDNLVAAGNTGEFYALALQEVLAVYAQVAQANAGRSALTAGVGRSLKEAIVLARAAEKEGADALMIHQPPDPFASPQGMVEYNHAVAGATKLPVILYVRRDIFSDDEFSKLLDHPNIVGMKYAFPDAPKLAERIRACRPLGKIAVCGLAEPWAAPFQAVGAQGFTSGLVNVLPELSIEVRDALSRGDYDTARRACERIAPFEAMRAMQGNGWNVTVVKQAMRAMGHAVGLARPPASPELPAPFARKVEALLADWGALPAAKKSA